MTFLGRSSLDERKSIWFPKILLDNGQYFHIIFIFWDLKKKKEKTVLCLCRLREGFWNGMERCTLKQITIKSHGKMYIIILNMYKDVKSCVTYNYCKADYFLWYGSEARGKLITFSVCYVPRRFIKCFLKMQILMV